MSLQTTALKRLRKHFCIALNATEYTKMTLVATFFSGTLVCVCYPQNVHASMTARIFFLRSALYSAMVPPRSENNFTEHKHVTAMLLLS